MISAYTTLLEQADIIQQEVKAFIDRHLPFMHPALAHQKISLCRLQSLATLS